MILTNTLIDILDKAYRYLLGVEPRKTYYPRECIDSNLCIVDLESISGIDLEKYIASSRNHDLFIFEKVFTNLHRATNIFVLLKDYGYTRSVLPIDNGVVVATKRNFDDDFLRKTVEVYRESFIYGPNPVHYNTAYLLYILTRAIVSKARKDYIVFEVGSGIGFSSIWIAKALENTGIEFVTTDVRCDRIEKVLKLAKELDLSIDAKCVDAKKVDVDKPIAMLFIDGAKNEYHLYLENLEKHLVKGSIVIAHNAVSNPDQLEPYLHRVFSNTRYKSMIIYSDPGGISLSIKMV